MFKSEILLIQEYTHLFLTLLQVRHLDHWFSTGDNFVHQEMFGNVWRHFCLSQQRGRSYWHLEARCVPK